MKSRLAIIDWGIGGISISKLVKDQLGNVPIIYLSDTGATPYGRMTRLELVSRLNKVISFLRTRGTTHLVIGCNAASTVIPFLNLDGMHVEGMIKPAVRLAARLRPERLALLGGKRTVLSGVYRRAFEERGIYVRQRIAQPLSALIESGDVSSTELRNQCRRILRPLDNCSHLLLACTHYPAIASILRLYVSDDVVFINPVSELIRSIKKWGMLGTGPDSYFTTGEPQGMKKAAWNAFGFRIKTARQIKI